MRNIYCKTMSETFKTNAEKAAERAKLEKMRKEFDDIDNGIQQTMKNNKDENTKVGNTKYSFGQGAKHPTTNSVGGRRPPEEFGVSI